ncbi:MAG TPA: spherulation-specific family 4 protein, partial [Rugosimonospora sp.]|nr:spherulation-specific family 4 protein [Rugosimonospora sp.]
MSIRSASARAVAAALAALSLGTLGALACATAAHADPVPALGQHVAVPAYIPPSDSASWSAIENSGPQLGFVVANVANGPDTALNTDWQTVIDATHGNGTKVLGYVDTGYFGFTTPARQTVLGDTDATAWLVQAEQDVNRWYAYYGSSVDGIFFDDAENICGPNGSSTYVDLYIELNQYVHTYHPGALTVANPGVGVPDCYEDAADILITFEGSYTDYLNPTGDYVTRQWQLDADPNKFWNLVYDVPDTTALATVLDTSKRNNAGYVYATPDTLPNPWDTVPGSTYWSAELAGTQVSDTTSPLTPHTPYSISTGSTKVHLGWTSDSWTREVGYDVYQGGTRIGYVGNFTPDDTDFLAYGLAPSTQYTFSLRGRDLAGTVSAASSTFTVTTAAWSAHAPTVPGSPGSSALAPTSVRLSWTASNDSDGYVASYDVYQDGTRLLTVDDSITSVHVGFLTPQQQYSFTVVARDNTGRPSAPSSTVTVTTPAPSGGPVASPAVDLTGTTAT